jgi:hypothetical protein
VSSPRTPSTSSPLLAAATAFDAELARYDHLSASLLRGELNSAKALDRAATALEQVAASEAELAVRAQKLLEAMGEARDGQQARSQAVRQRATEVQGRKALFDKLAEGQELLGESAAHIMTLSEELLRRHRAPNGHGNGNGNGGANGSTNGHGAAEPGAADPSLAGAVGELIERMQVLVTSAQDLVTAAKAAGFEDVTRHLESIRQKLTSASNRLGLVGARLGLGLKVDPGDEGGTPPRLA